MEDQIVVALQQNAISKLEKTATFERYSKIPNQVVCICRHHPCSIGGYHDHDFFEINYVKKGSCVNFIEGETLYMPEGSFVLINIGIFHTLYAPDEDSMIYNVLLDKDWLLNVIKRHPPENVTVSDFISSVGADPRPLYMYSPTSSKKAEDILADQYNDTASPSILKEINLMRFLCEIMSAEGYVISSAKKTTNKTMQELLSYVNQNFNTVTLESLSDYIGYSTTHIGRMFKKHLGKSFSDFVRSIRINHAEYLLSFSGMPISEISSTVGYENAEHFCRVFKSEMGLSPRTYRQMRRKQIRK